MSWKPLGDTIVSPLRYPGAKRRFVRLIGDTIRANGLAPKLFVEPFAGGASVALQLLSDGVVERVGLAEVDPLVSSFWKAVFWDTDWLVRRVKETKITLDLWDRLRTGPLRSDRERAFACLYLNRTSFSGILSSTGGPLGGRKQCSGYKLNCRFPRGRLVTRIRRIAKMRSRIDFIRNASWQKTLAQCAKSRLAENDVFFYLDPPFYFKADRLYTHYFNDTDHVELRDVLKGLRSPWFLSYDPSDFIADLYTQNGTSRHVEVVYTAACSGRSARREMVVTNLSVLPVEPDSRMVRSSAGPPKHARAADGGARPSHHALCRGHEGVTVSK